MNDPFGVSKGLFGAGKKAATKANKYTVRGLDTPPKAWGNNTSFPKRTKSTHSYDMPSTRRSLAPGEEARAVPSGMGDKQGSLYLSDKLKKGKAYKKQTIEHERAHLRPKRNSANLERRLATSPARLGREEARATYLAGQTRSSYPKNGRPTGFKEGFDEVYTKMTNAGTKKKVRKSMSDPFGIYSVSKKERTDAENMLRYERNRAKESTRSNVGSAVGGLMGYKTIKEIRNADIPAMPKASARKRASIAWDKSAKGKARKKLIPITGRAKSYSHVARNLPRHTKAGAAVTGAAIGYATLHGAYAENDRKKSIKYANKIGKAYDKNNYPAVGGSLGAASGGAAAITAPQVGDSLYRGIKRKNKETRGKPQTDSPRAKKIRRLKVVTSEPASKTHSSWKAAGKLVKTPKRGAYIAGAGLIGTGTALGAGAGKAFEDKRKRSQ